MMHPQEICTNSTLKPSEVLQAFDSVVHLSEVHLNNSSKIRDDTFVSTLLKYSGKAQRVLDMPLAQIRIRDYNVLLYTSSISITSTLTISSFAGVVRYCK